MNGKYFLTPAIAILAIALVGYAETTRTTGVVSVGPIMPTVSTPRVRVANDGLNQLTYGLYQTEKKPCVASVRWVH